MAYKCCIVHCRSNYSEQPAAGFCFPKGEDIRRRWMKFVNTQDW